MEDKKTIFWCKHCKTPVITDKSNAACTICGAKVRYLCADLRPVFPEERLLMEILLQKPLTYINSVVWASTKGRYCNVSSTELMCENLDFPMFLEFLQHQWSDK